MRGREGQGQKGRERGRTEGQGKRERNKDTF